MSDKFTIRTSRSTIKKLGEIIDSWIKADQNQRQVIVSHSSSPEYYHLFGEGSILGFSLTPSSSLWIGGRILVRLNQMASQADWRFCYSFLAYLLRTQPGTTIHKYSEKMEASVLTEEKAAEKSRSTLQSGFRVLWHLITERKVGPLTMPTPWFDLVVTREDLDSVVNSEDSYLKLEKLLAERATKLGFCRHANIIELKKGLTLNALGPEPAIYPETDYAALAKKDFLGIPVDKAEMIFVKFKDFLDVFREKIEQVKKEPALYYFSGIDPANSRDISLYETLVKLGQDELPV